MTMQAGILLTVFLLALLILAYPLGHYLAEIGEGKAIRGLTWMKKTEHFLYRLAGVPPESEMTWKAYASALLVFNALGILVVYAMQRLQAWLPLNPQGVGNVSPDSSFNTAVSFATNTNWQGYSGESTMSYLTQMLALGVQNFFSAATGIAVAYALIRAFQRHSVNSIGNFWHDISRSTLYLLLPLATLVALLLASQGVIQNFSAYKEVRLVEPLAYQPPESGINGWTIKDEKGNPPLGFAVVKTQVLAMGPVASQEAIKLLGTNGGGFFNANSAHPYENPTAFSNFIEMLSILLIPAALCFAFGRMVGDMRQGWAILGAMTAIFLVMAPVILIAEQQAHPALQALDIDQAAGDLQPGGNMEGKESRFGISASALFAVVTTAASCGAVNAMHDSFTPLGGLAPMLLMQLGEVVFGGAGSGLYGMLIFALLAVFIAGLMIGRTPEYLGKKIQSFEIKMISMAILITPFLVLGGTALAVTASAGKAGILNPGAHGFSEILYAFSSAANNNGSAFAGLSANTRFYNILLAMAMLFGRFIPIVAVLAIAGSLAAKKRIGVTAGTMPTHGLLFTTLLAGIVVIVGALTYIPALALGPVIEHLQIYGSR